MSNLRHAIHGIYKTGAEYVMPVRSQTGFKDSGVLTPEEFISSGDYLVRTCPTWSWATGDPQKRRPYLPADKQYLITRNVPSTKRAADVEQYGEQAGESLDDMGDGWFATPHTAQTAEDVDVIDDLSLKPEAAKHDNGLGDSDDDIPDIDDLTLEDDDPEATGTTKEPSPAHIVQTRTYDLLISYDKYYQVPRFWLVGYSENGEPLASKQILEDVSEEHARKTITVDPFPHSSLVAASIHPCKHASVMKKLGTMAEEGGKEVRVENYLIIFLKFMASVVPSIEYDYTMAAGW